MRSTAVHHPANGSALLDCRGTRPAPSLEAARRRAGRGREVKSLSATALPCRLLSCVRPPSRERPMSAIGRKRTLGEMQERLLEPKTMSRALPVLACSLGAPESPCEVHEV